MQRQPREPTISLQSCQQVILGMLRSADSLYCTRTCTGRKWLGRTIVPPKQMTACRLCTCKSSHALVALIHVPLKNKQMKNLLLTVFYVHTKTCLEFINPLGMGTAVLAHNQVTTVQQVMAHGEISSNCSHAWLFAGSKCKVIQLSLMLSCCKLNFCCLTFAWINTTQMVS